MPSSVLGSGDIAKNTRDMFQTFSTGDLQEGENKQISKQSNIGAW